MIPLAATLTPGNLALSAALGGTLLFAAFLIVVHAARLRAGASFVRLMLVFVAVVGLFHAGSIATAYIFVRAGVHLEPTAPTARLLLIQSVGVITVCAWDIWCLLIGSSARKAGYGTKLFDFTSAPFRDGSLPFVRVEVVRRLRRSVIAGSVAALAAGAVLMSRQISDEHLEDPVKLFVFVWAGSFIAVIVLLTIIYHFMGDGDPLGNVPRSSVLRPHPGNQGDLGGRVLSKREAAKALEE